MKTVLTALLLGTFATAALAQSAPTAPVVPATKADCEKAKDMKWDDKGGKDGKGACIAAKAEAPKK